MKAAIEQAISEFDSLSDMARQLEVSYQLIQDWEKRGTVPAKYCPKIEKLLNGKVRCEQLNEEVDWEYLRQTFSTTA